MSPSPETQRRHRSIQSEEVKKKNINPSQVKPTNDRRRAKTSSPCRSAMRTKTGAVTMTAIKNMRTMINIVPKGKALLIFKNTYRCNKL
jgi:hypothetical protein